MPIEPLQQAIEREHQCSAMPLESRVVTVREGEDGDAVSRHIKTFALRDQPTARRAYGWERGENPHPGDLEYTIVLQGPGVNSPENALRLKIREIWRSL